MEFSDEPFQTMQVVTDSPQVPPFSRSMKRKSMKRKLIYCVCSIATAKSLLLLLNLVCIIVGSGVLGVGLWAGFDKRSFIDYTGWVEDKAVKDKISDIADETPLGRAPIILVIFGAMLLILSILGCIAAIGESRCLLTCYAMILLTFMLMEIATAGAAIGYRNEAKDYIKANMKSTLLQYVHPASREDKNGITFMWDRIMANYECCGVDNFTDLEQSKYWITNSTIKIPSACCILRDKKSIFPQDFKCANNPTEENSNMNKGCYNALAAEVENYNTVPMLVVSVLAVGQAMGIILAFSLCQSITVFKVKKLCEYRQRRRSRA
jgi:hypothetical protein